MGGKVDNPCLIPFFINRTSIFEWYVVQCLKKTNAKRHEFKRDYTHVKKKITVLGSIFNINGDDIYDYLTSTNFVHFDNG